MKLQYQLNIAFTTLLTVILTVTGFVIYSLLLDLLIIYEERQLEQKGELLVTVLNEQYSLNEETTDFSDFLREQDLQLMLYNREQNHVLYSTMPDHIVEGFIGNDHFVMDNESLWEYRKEKFVTSRILFYPRRTGLELILLTPLHDLQAVQQSFFARLLLVFIIGTMAATILSYLLTRKLVTPLTRLQRQLKKVETRQFDQIERIKATGEIKEVEQSIYDMASELQRYMTSQQAFFQNASHELKTPLMTIQGYAEGIRDHVFDEEDSEKGLEIMVTEVRRLKAIINEMILLAKLDSDQAVYEFKEVQVAHVIQQVIERTLPLASERNITLEFNAEAEITLQADEEQLLRALLNVTVNGLRYANSQVMITVKRVQKEKIILIEDDGEGISKELIPHVFHRFVKGKEGETGLGLAISRAIVTQLNGKITVEESELGGAKFKMTF